MNSFANVQLNVNGSFSIDLARIDQEKLNAKMQHTSRGYLAIGNMVHFAHTIGDSLSAVENTVVH